MIKFVQASCPSSCPSSGPLEAAGDGTGSQALTRQPADGLKGGSDVFTLTDPVLFEKKKVSKSLQKTDLMTRISAFTGSKGVLFLVGPAL